MASDGGKAALELNAASLSKGVSGASSSGQNGRSGKGSGAKGSASTSPSSSKSGEKKTKAEAGAAKGPAPPGKTSEKAKPEASKEEGAADGPKRKRSRMSQGEWADGEVIRSGTIRRIMKLEKDVKMTGSEAVFLVSKACELFVGLLVDRTVLRAHSEDRKIVKYQDAAAVVAGDPMLELFAELLPETTRLPK